MEKIVLCEPAYDMRDPDPKKNYGIHGMNLRFVLKGSRGAVQFLIFTNWQLPHVQEDLYHRAAGKDAHYLKAIIGPMAADVGYHSPKPMYEDQGIQADKCECLDGKPCYYDGSGLRAEEMFNLMVREGDKAMWAALEEYYSSTFGELE